MSVQAPKGTRDMLPQDSFKWHYIEAKMRDTARVYGFSEIRTPVFEHTELFLRGIGDTTDVVQKEMYTFNDKKGRSITLKPEGTAGATRAFIEAGLCSGAQPTKLYYLYCPVFRYEKPQSGRLREHHQFGVECFGAKSPMIDAQIIALGNSVLTGLGVKNLALHINSIGCPQCRPQYNAALKEYFAPHIDEMCDDCRARFEKNPLRLLDCKEEKCGKIAANAPAIIDCLCPECAEHFVLLQKYLTACGIPFSIDSRIVRGLDYYTKTVFEFVITQGAFKGTVCGGGRYDGLVGELGGPEMPGIGFGMGMERLLIVLEDQQLLPNQPADCDVYFAPMGGDARELCLSLCARLRARGVSCDTDVMERGIKGQLKYAAAAGARYTVIIGEDELKNGAVALKNMETRVQTALSLNELLSFDFSK